MQVRLFKPSVGYEEKLAISEIFDTAWLGLGPKVQEFEKRWAEYIGCKYAIAVNSGTAALHLALAGFRIPKKKKVLVPAMTFVSTAAAVLYNNLEPVFVDIDEKTLSIDLEDMGKKITEDTAAVMPVHMGGHPVAMEKLLQIAKEHKLLVIEDCAHCTGGEYMGRKLGNWGDVGCFSFEEKKCMTTGDGGMICTNHDIADDLRAIRWMGIDKDTWKRAGQYTARDEDARHWYYEISLLGYKYNMNDLCASIGLAQLKKLDRMNANRMRAIGRYLSGIQGLTKIKPLLPYNLDGKHSYWNFGIRTEHRDELMLFLKERQIATGVHYTPLPLHPIFRGYQADFSFALKVYKEMMTLPLFSDISDQEIDYVIDALHAWEKVS